MKHLELFENFEGIPWSGKDVTKAPVIGVIHTKPMEFGGFKIPAGTDEIVEISDTEKGKIYVTNKWRKPGIPYIVHEDMVDKYEPKTENK